MLGPPRPESAHLQAIDDSPASANVSDRASTTPAQAPLPTSPRAIKLAGYAKAGSNSASILNGKGAGPPPDLPRTTKPADYAKTGSSSASIT